MDKRKKPLPVKKEPSISPYQVVFVIILSVLLVIKFGFPDSEKESRLRPGQVWQHRLLVTPYVDNLAQEDVIVTRECKILSVSDEGTVIFSQYGDTMELSEEGFLFQAERIR